MRKTERLIRDLVGLSDDQPADDKRLINELDVYLRVNPKINNVLKSIWSKGIDTYGAQIMLDGLRHGNFEDWFKQHIKENLESEVEETQLS